MGHVIIDVVTILVMAVAAYYAARLNRSLTRARDGRAELVQLIASLTDAQNRAEGAIQAMKATAAEYELSLSKQIAVSRGLADELSMINDTGNTLASRLERLAPLARAGLEPGGRDFFEETRPVPTLRAERPFSAAPESRSPSVKAKPAEERPQAKAAATPATASQPQQRAEKPAAAAASGEPEPRSRAERELFAAIETLRKGRS